MTTAEERALDFAEDLGRLLGMAEKRANAWLHQRGEVTRQLTAVRDKATRLLERLDGLDGIGRGRRPGASAGSRNGAARGGPGGGGTKGTRTRKGMSAAARKAVGARMRRYWAERRKAATSA